MEPLYTELFRVLHAEKQDTVLTIVTQTNSSTPRAQGAAMFTYAKGTVGTIGGGEAEYLSQQIARDVLRTKQSFTKHFSLSPSEVANTGMVCGGEMDVLFLFLSADAPENQLIYSQIRSAEQQKEAFFLLIDMTQYALIFWSSRLASRSIPAELSQSLSTCTHSGGIWTQAEHIFYILPFLHAGTVYIFGGGHVAKALAPILRTVHFQVTIYEDRADFVGDGILGSFEQIASHITLGSRDAAVIMTRGHQSDAVVLSQVLSAPLWYIGMIGSRQKIAATRERLLAEGFTPEAFARLHSPIGLPIHAETPEEIAISIAAEMILCKRQKG